MEKIEDLLEMQGCRLLKREDTFNFRCTCCGACCRNREDVILNIHDILRIQSYLNISFQELIEEYGDLYIGFPSKIPIVRIKPKGKNKICPFLYKGKCKIHTIKPAVCALFPLARVTKINLKGNTAEVQYALQKTTCGARDTINKVENWVRDYDSERNLAIISKWNEFIAKASQLIHSLEFQPDEIFYSYMTYILYENYPKDVDLVVEINYRMQALSSVIQEISESDNENQKK